MKFGQRYNGKGKISSLADYVQFNICGLSAIEIIQRYFMYEINKPIVLLGDYTSEERNAREDDMLHAERIYEIKDVISSLQDFGADVMAITIHPVSKKGLEKLGVNVSINDFVNKLNDIYQIPVLMKNRQYHSLHLSCPEEVIKFSQSNKMTLDLTLLYEACEYDIEKFLDAVNRINRDNVQELHIRQISMSQSSLVGNRGMSQQVVDPLNIAKLFTKVPWATFSFLESGGGHARFDSIVKNLVNSIDNDGN